MSDEINQFDVQEGRTMGWHGKTKINEILSLVNCWLASWDYRIEKLLDSKGKATPFCALGVTDIEDLYVGRSFTPDTFKPIMNAKLIELLDKGTAGKDLLLASAGTVKDRGRHYFSFQMGEEYRAAGRIFVPYFNVGNGNDQSSPLWQNTSSTCTVCNNTFTGNMLNAGLIMEVKKTKFSELKLGDFSKAMRAMLAGQKEFADMLEELAKIKLAEDQARAFFAGFVGTPKQPLASRAENIVERLVTLYKDPSVGNTGENYSDVFQAITDYYSHESAGGEDKWKQFVSSEFGSAANQKKRAWTILNVPSQREGMSALGRDILQRTIDAAKAAA